MRVKSIRRQLPISYAAIALLAALSLGVVLMLVLRGYYAQLEKNYLETNAKSISSLIGQSIALGLPQPFIQSQVNSLAFLSQTQVTVYDQNNRMLAQSDVPDQTWVSFGQITNPIDAVENQQNEAVSIFYFQNNPASAVNLLNSTIEINGPQLKDKIVQLETDQNLLKITLLPSHYSFIGHSLYGNQIGENELFTGTRSRQVVKQVIVNQNQEALGTIQLSDGPAYGSEILRSVARGWLLAGSLSILLAAAAGWLVSRRITGPLTELTERTARMAAGDLSVRANPAQAEELNLLAQSFNEMAVRVQDTISTLRNFISDAAHELQTPTTALKTDLELSRESLHSGDSLHVKEVYIPRALTQVERLKTLTNNLLNLSRIEGKDPLLEPQVINLPRLVLELSEAYAARAEQAGIELALDGLDTSVQIMGNPGQIVQAVGNLLDNAIKFTPENGLIAVKMDKDEQSVSLDVFDTGIGIPEEDLPYLFKRFHRGKNSAAYPGSGLGLAIVQAIMERHNGSVEVLPAPAGAHFRLRFTLVNS